MHLCRHFALCFAAIIRNETAISAKPCIKSFTLSLSVHAWLILEINEMAAAAVIFCTNPRSTLCSYHLTTLCVFFLQEANNGASTWNWNNVKKHKFWFLCTRYKKGQIHFYFNKMKKINKNIWSLDKINWKISLPITHLINDLIILRGWVIL